MLLWLKARRDIAAVASILQRPNQIIHHEPGFVTMQIAYDLHGCDPRQLSHADQIAALDMAAGYGREEFVDTAIALLPLQLRAAACRSWDHLNSRDPK